MGLFGSPYKNPSLPEFRRSNDIFLYVNAPAANQAVPDHHKTFLLNDLQNAPTSSLVVPARSFPPAC
jgi:hypothetical protein